MSARARPGRAADVAGLGLAGGVGRPAARPNTSSLENIRSQTRRICRSLRVQKSSQLSTPIYRGQSQGVGPVCDPRLRVLLLGRAGFRPRPHMRCRSVGSNSLVPRTHSNCDSPMPRPGRQSHTDSSWPSSSNGSNHGETQASRGGRLPTPDLVDLPVVAETACRNRPPRPVPLKPFRAVPDRSSRATERGTGHQFMRRWG